ncbi:MAG: GTPase Era [Bdellovibrionota bacterium]
MTTTLKCGFVTLVGLPNAGKSSLLNRLVGEELAIVTPKAQTTWQTLRGFLAKPDLELVITDTPGLQEGTVALNAALRKNAAKALSLAAQGNELIGLVIDAAELGARLRDKKPLGLEPIRRVIEEECGRLPLSIPCVLILNKSDLVRKQPYRDELEEIASKEFKGVFSSMQKILWTSVKTGEGIENCLEEFKAVLPMGQSGSLFDTEDLTDQNLRGFAAEFVREQCFLQLGAEIPYSIAVEITQFDEKDPKISRIEATLHVERESQKSIVLGEGGKKIKAIGMKAREKLERLLGRKVFLGLRVKVTPHWAREARWVERFGYGKAE